MFVQKATFNIYTQLLCSRKSYREHTAEFSVLLETLKRLKPYPYIRLSTRLTLVLLYLLKAIYIYRAAFNRFIPKICSRLQDGVPQSRLFRISDSHQGLCSNRTRTRLRCCVEATRVIL